MNAFEELLNNRWIVKSRDKEKYYRVKDAIGDFKTFAIEKLGYRIISNPYIVKMEKMPGEPQAWMGIDEFTDCEDYSFFCIVLMFLEDKEVEEQFVLSQLTEYIAGVFPEGMDWTLFANRRKLVRVIKFCLKNDLILIDAGNEDEFSQDAGMEALFENTGLSRYFMHNFGRDISEYSRPEDFFRGEWVGMDEDRGLVRRQRVYRRLLLAPGVYKKDTADEDFAYIKNFRNLIEEDFQKYTDCSLQVHKGSAYIIAGENGNIGDVLPANNSLMDGVLLMHGLIRERLQGKIDPADRNESSSAAEKSMDTTTGAAAAASTAAGAVVAGAAVAGASKATALVMPLAANASEIINISWVELSRLAEECYDRYSQNFAKKHRDMSKEAYAQELIAEMERLNIIEIDEMTGRVDIYPIVGKIQGEYKNTEES